MLFKEYFLNESNNSNPFEGAIKEFKLCTEEDLKEAFKNPLGSKQVDFQTQKAAAKIDIYSVTLEKGNNQLVILAYIEHDANKQTAPLVNIVTDNVAWLKGVEKILMAYAKLSTYDECVEFLKAL